MYKIFDKKVILEDRRVLSYLPVLGWGSQGDVYKIRIDKDFYALKVFNGIEKAILEDYEQKYGSININSNVLNNIPFEWSTTPWPWNRRDL